jgi:hypothetical protein
VVLEAESRSCGHEPDNTHLVARTVEDDVVKYTRSGNPVTAPEGTVHQIRRDSAAIVSRWKEILTKEEIAGVYRITHPVCDRLYTDEDWGDFSR